VLVDQWRAWPYLRRRITHEWNTLFAPVLVDFQRLDSALKRDITYLAARYEAIAAELAARTQGGAVFVWCPVCEYDTDQLDGHGSKAPLENSKCLVCETTDRVLKTTCPKCEKLLVLRSDLHGPCPCGYVPDPGIASHCGFRKVWRGAFRKVWRPAQGSAVRPEVEPCRKSLARAA
jgi:hypothetical protein